MLDACKACKPEAFHNTAVDAGAEDLGCDHVLGLQVRGHDLKGAPRGGEGGGGGRHPRQDQALNRGFNQPHLLLHGWGGDWGSAWLTSFQSN